MLAQPKLMLLQSWTARFNKLKFHMLSSLVIHVWLIRYLTHKLVSLKAKLLYLYLGLIFLLE